MPRGSKPGEQRGGRKKGTRNALTIETRAALLRHCQAEGTDPFHVMVRLLKSKDAKTRLMAASELADRILPKLKSIELTGNPDKPVHLTTDQMTPAERAARQARIAALEAKRRGDEHGPESR